MNIINKIAFIVHEPVMYDHYSTVWSMLQPDTFIIILYGFSRLKDSDENAREIALVEKLDKLAYEYAYSDDILNSGRKYKYVVTNHVIGITDLHPQLKAVVWNNRKNFIKGALNLLTYRVSKHKFLKTMRIDKGYLPFDFGVKQVRFMYGADIGDGWSLQFWNELYDLFLCHGPNDRNEIRKRFTGKTVIMGYPRYDAYFKEGLNTANVISEFGIDSSKKTILWMPTSGLGVCSIPLFAEKVAELMEVCNVIVRPHPISFKAEPEYIELLKRLDYKIDSNAIRNMNELYKVSDMVLCDFGGSAFGAIYLDKDFILLDMPNTEASLLAENESNHQLFEHVPVLNVDNFHYIDDLIADEGEWIEWRRKRNSLFDRYFADNRGTSSLKAVEILNNLDKLIG